MKYMKEFFRSTPSIKRRDNMGNQLAHKFVSPGKLRGLRSKILTPFIFYPSFFSVI